jgi:N-acetyl-gamma-glutamylphosphate reductase
MNASKHPRWNDYIIGTNGYKKIRVGRAHPLADSKGYAYEHLIVWVSAGQGLPGAGQGLHHRNWDRRDNRISNLQMLTITNHKHIHAAKQRRDKKGMFAK